MLQATLVDLFKSTSISFRLEDKVRLTDQPPCSKCKEDPKLGIYQ